MQSQANNTGATRRPPQLKDARAGFFDDARDIVHVRRQNFN